MKRFINYILQLFAAPLSLANSYRYCNYMIKPFAFFSVLLACVGFGLGLLWAPVDAVQGDAYRIIYIHVPAAFLSLFIYTIIFICSVIFKIWKIKIFDLIAAASAPIGAVYCAIALVTGSIWGKPMWGTWWVWDARLTSELVLLFLYLGYIALRSAAKNKQVGAELCAILAIIGFIDIPIIHYSVQWWNTLHQGASISNLNKVTVAGPILWPLLVCLLSLVLFYLLITALNLRSLILEREKNSKWIKQEFTSSC